MARYLPTIGLEIHAELNTRTKMFCGSKNDAAEKRPNINVCPVCMAHPGTLPVINKAAVQHVLRVGAALGSSLADYTEFDRKNYFYPDLPKGYQLSQYEFPLVSGGMLNGVQLTRIHLEEDTASSIHDENSDTTLIDYNRAGVPLMELVTEPVIHTATDAGNFGRELQLLLRYLGASEADMEKGQMRLEANISVAKISDEEAANIQDQSWLVSSNALSDKISGTPGSADSSRSGKDSADMKSAADISSQTQLKASGVVSDDVTVIKTAAMNDSGTSQNTGEVNVPNVSSKNSGASSAQNIALLAPLATSHSALEKKPVAAVEGSANTSRDVSELASALAGAAVNTSKLGTKVEVKNINSFRAMERAVQFEIKRQVALLEKGEKIVQETRGWDENKQATFSQRIKEGSADYRYFPDPDLPSLKLSEVGLTKDVVEKTLPELPWQKRQRLGSFGINTQDIELYVKDSLFGTFFEAAEKELSGNAADIKLASNYIANDLVKLVADAVGRIRDAHTRDTKILNTMPISPSNFAKIVRMASAKKISSRSAKDLLVLCMDGTTDPDIAANEGNLIQDSSGAQIGPTVAKIITDNPAVVSDLKSGKAAALEFLVGQGMKALRGAADPVALRDEFRAQLK